MFRKSSNEKFFGFFRNFLENFFRLFTAPCVLCDTVYNVLSVYDNVLQLIRLAKGRFQVLKFEC